MCQVNDIFNALSLLIKELLKDVICPNEESFCKVNRHHLLCLFCTVFWLAIKYSCSSTPTHTHPLSYTRLQSHPCTHIVPRLLTHTYTLMSRDMLRSCWQHWQTGHHFVPGGAPDFLSTEGRRSLKRWCGRVFDRPASPSLGKASRGKNSRKEAESGVVIRCRGRRGWGTLEGPAWWRA